MGELGELHVYDGVSISDLQVLVEDLEEKGYMVDNELSEGKIVVSERENETLT